MKRVCVIGATSPLGLTLVPALAETGYAVAASYRNEDLLPADWSKSEDIGTFRLDLKSEEPLPDLAYDGIVWLAHLDAGRFNEAEPETNLRTFDRALESIAATGVGKFLFVSSGGSVYGHAQNLPISEDHERNPISSYGIAKKAMEDRLMEFGNEIGIATAILRPGNIYGFERPGRETKGVIGAFLNAIIQNTPFTLIHDGKTVRDMIHVDDVCRAVVKTIEANEKQIVWNVGTGRGAEVIEMLNAILRKTGRKMPETENRENFTSDVVANVLSPERISAATGWKAQIGLDEGIDKTLQHWNLLSLSNEISS